MINLLASSEQVEWMRDLAKSLRTPSVQSQVRRNMQHVSSFQVPTGLPKDLTAKLEELDRVFAAYEAKKS